MPRLSRDEYYAEADRMTEELMEKRMQWVSETLMGGTSGTTVLHDMGELLDEFGELCTTAAREPFIGESIGPEIEAKYHAILAKLPIIPSNT